MRGNNAKFSISTHAIIKHLDQSNYEASTFYSWNVMHMCASQCLENADKVTMHGRCVELIKTFEYNIGISKLRKQPLNTVRVVYTWKQHSIFIITVYPIEKK